jgi:hypothetical protein
MVEALENDELIHEGPAIVGSQTPSALTHTAVRSLLKRSGREPPSLDHPSRTAS